MKKYLNYGQIQAIADAVAGNELWGARQTIIDTLVYMFANGLSENVSDYAKYVEQHTELLEKGVFDKLRKRIKNYNQIYEALNYVESIEALFRSISKHMPELSKVLEKNGNINGLGTDKKNK